MVLVSRASAAIDVQHSNTASSWGVGTVWKWSYTQTASNPACSASSAQRLIVSNFSTGSRMSARSMRQPWGKKTPSFSSSATR